MELRRLVFSSAAVGAVLLLAACSGRYLGIDTASLDPEAASLVDRSSVGDKSAQYDLALRYASGRGIPRDCKMARRLMRIAATKEGGRIWVYSPPVGQSAGRVIPVDTGPEVPGLSAARAALADPTFCQDGIAVTS